MVLKSNEKKCLSRRDFLSQTAMAGLGLAASGLPGLGWAIEQDVLHIRTYNDVKFLDPALMLSGSESLIDYAIYRSLVRFRTDGSWDWELDGAEEFEQVDDRRYFFQLEPGIMFNNGFGEMTAEDVKYSLERVVDPALSSTNAGDMGPLSHVEVVDRYCGVIVLAEPFAAFIPIGLCGSTGCIISKDATESVGGRYTIEPPACSGPYQFKSWQAQRKTVLERNPAWRGEPGDFREIHIYAMNDVKAGELAFEAGQLDCTQASIESVEVFRRNMPPASHMQVFKALRFFWVGLNKDHPRLQDLRVRQAVQWGIDVEAVLEAAWFGLSEPATGIIAPGLIGHREKADIPPRGDAEVARALLREAGVEQPYRITLDVSSTALQVTAAQVIQWSLKKAGFEVELRSQDNATLITMGMESAGERWKDIQLHLQSFFMLGDPYYATEWFVSDQVGIWNWERFSNKEFDRLHKLAMSSSDPLERDRSYQRMQHLMEASGCYRFLTHGLEPVLYRDHIDPVFRADGYPMYAQFRLKHDGKV
jgi:peptide/nickel transport system substrate-binding protein